MWDSDSLVLAEGHLMTAESQPDIVLCALFSWRPSRRGGPRACYWLQPKGRYADQLRLAFKTDQLGVTTCEEKGLRGRGRA